MPDRKVYSLNDIVTAATTTIGANSANLTDFSPGGNLRAIIDSFAFFVEFLQTQINVAFDSFAIPTATGQDLYNRGKDFNVIVKQGVNAYTNQTFSRNTPAPSNFTIPAGSQISTQPDVFGKTIDFTTNVDIVFPSGAISVTGLITCTQAGVIGNVASGTITNITGVLSGVDSVTNTAAVTTGADPETDEQYKVRIPTSINGLKSSNADAIQAAALAIPGITVLKIVDNQPAAGQITVYVSNQSGILSQTQISQVQTAVQDAVAFGIIANVATPTVTYVMISMTVTYDSTNYNQSIIDQNIKTAVYQLVSINPDTDLKIVDIITATYKIPGVTNVQSVQINGSTSDFTVTGFGVIRLSDPQNSFTISYVAG